MTGHIGMLRVSDTGSSESLIGSPTPRDGSSLDSRISPDGRCIVYSSSEDGPMAVYVRPFPDVSSAQWQVSTRRGGYPMWGRDGRELFYRDGRSIVAVPVTTTPTFDAGPPAVLFDSAPEHVTLYDVAPDGRFLTVSRSEEELAPQPILVVRNWFEELRARVPSQ